MAKKRSGKTRVPPRTRSTADLAADAAEVSGVVTAHNLGPANSNAAISGTGAFQRSAFQSSAFETGVEVPAPGGRPQHWDASYDPSAEIIAANQRKLSAAVLSTAGKTEPPFPVVSDSGASTEATRGVGASIAAAVGAAAGVATATAVGEARTVEVKITPDVGAIARRISERPVDIRDAARVLSREFAAQIKELKRSKPNDAIGLAKHDSLVTLFEKMASGLAELADNLDKAFSEAKEGKPEPVFLGRAAEIARHLNLGLTEWLEENRTLVIEVPIRISLFGLGVAFLHSIDADSATAIAGLAALALKRAPKTCARSEKPKRRGGVRD